jgi:uncharacterized membrane protein YgdD (TMEM256/DUF423 family)
MEPNSFRGLPMALWLIAAGVNGLLAVAMGAVAAHALRSALDPAALAWIETGSRYQLWHALALLAVALLLAQGTGAAQRRLLHVTGALFFAGMILFAGSLYLLALTGLHAWAWFTPFGGLALMAGWLGLIAHGIARWRTGRAG